MKRRTLVAVALALIASTPGRAHDFWIEPPPSVVPAGARVGLGLRVGDEYPGERYARNPNHLEWFRIFEPESTVDVDGSPGQEPAGVIRVSRPGLYVAAYRSGDTPTDIEPQKFENYLAAKGLDDARRTRLARHELDKPARERFSRCAKALFRVGGGSPLGFDRRVGLPLEIIPETDPFGGSGDGTLAVLVLLDQKPRSGLLVLASRPGASEAVDSQRTDGDGRARLKLDRAGEWRISTVAMKASERKDADWESLWSSLTFRRP